MALPLSVGVVTALATAAVVSRGAVKACGCCGHVGRDTSSAVTPLTLALLRIAVA